MFNLNKKELESVVASFQIPVKPEILTKIQMLMSEAEPNIEKIAALISSDVGLSASTLKIINCPFYGMERRISEIKLAVMVLGLKTIDGLITSLCLKESFKGEASISLERFWDDSVDVANAMAFIGKKIEKKIPNGMLYTIGLFRDCGIPLLALKHKDYKNILIEANSQGKNSFDLEEKNYQTNHTVLGYYVASSWNLPKNICTLILQHHDKKFLSVRTGSLDQLAFSVLKAAENMIEIVKRTNLSPDWSEVDEDVLKVLGISSADYAGLVNDFTEIYNQ